MPACVGRFKWDSKGGTAAGGTSLNNFLGRLTRKLFLEGVSKTSPKVPRTTSGLLSGLNTLKLKQYKRSFRLEI